MSLVNENIVMDSITKKYEKSTASQYALRKVNLHVCKGEYIALCGASGSGKSTLLSILGGMETATSGSYLFDGKNIAQKNTEQLHQFRKENVAMIFQDFGLMSYYTALENTEIMLRIKGVQKKERRKLSMEALEKVGIQKLSGKYPSDLSGGEQQRVAIARAIASGNQLILADEPTGALDRQNGIAIMKLMDTLREEGRTIIMATHNDQIANFADRVLYIEDGCLDA